MGRRHLSLEEVESALRAGRPVEQWLGRSSSPLGTSIRWLSLAPNRSGGFSVSRFEVLDVGTSEFIDVYEFPSLDPNRPDGERHHSDSAGDALELAQRVFGAHPDRYVNAGVVQEEYRDARFAPPA